MTLKKAPEGTFRVDIWKGTSCDFSQRSVGVITARSEPVLAKSWKSSETSGVPCEVSPWSGGASAPTPVFGRARGRFVTPAQQVLTDVLGHKRSGCEVHLSSATSSGSRYSMFALPSVKTLRWSSVYQVRREKINLSLNTMVVIAEMLRRFCRA